MPFQDIIDFPQNRKIGIFHITESELCLLPRLSPDIIEKDQLLSIHHPEKRMEWITARLILQQLCQDSGIPFTGISKEPNGKPRLPDSAVEISISHSYPYVAVIMDPRQAVGIDLEQPREKLLKIAPRFLGEKELLFAGNDLELLCLLWCAKEALYKILSRQGVVFKEHFLIEPFTKASQGTIYTRIQFEEVDRDYTLYYEDRGEYVFVFNLSMNA